MSHLLVFSNDPLSAYVAKGEIKERYFNPESCFDKVTICTPCDHDIDPEEVQGIVGDAELHVVPIGSMKTIKRLCTIPRQVNRVLHIVQSLSPDVIRAYNPRFEGLFATLSARVLGVPSVISLHGDFSRKRLFQVEGWSCVKSLVYSAIFRVYTERQSYSEADVVIGAYKFPLRYFHGLPYRRREVIYNRVYAPSETQGSKNKEFTIISVGRHIPGKDPRNLIRAICGTSFRLILIGQGPLTEPSRILAKRLRVMSQVDFIPSVPNRDIYSWHQKAHVFAMSMLYGGVSIPMLEAMACKLPLVLARPLWEKVPEVIGKDCLLVDDTPESFQKALRKLAKDSALCRSMGERSWARYWPIRGEVMERKEAELYRGLLKNKVLR